MSYIICLKCKSRTAYGVVDVNTFYNSIIYECINCDVIYNICSVCFDTTNSEAKLMRLVKYDTFENDILKIESCKQPIYFYDNCLGPITGDNGGLKSVWYCVDCDKNYSFSDK